jgi:hypothetical protein
LLLPLGLLGGAFLGLFLSHSARRSRICSAARPVGRAPELNDGLGARRNSSGALDIVSSLPLAHLSPLANTHFVRVGLSGEGMAFSLLMPYVLGFIYMIRHKENAPEQETNQ